eukprot:a867349_13.p1 GENE.a867349_13~~a867349_13.p1  ORF type:complete len:207 (-),score=69.16 a867349_13:13-543(-)
MAAVVEGGSKKLKYKGLEPDLLCNVCEQISAAVTDALDDVHPTATVPVGTRTRADGSYATRRYARSEARVFEILDGICERTLSDVSGVQTNEGGKRVLVNVNRGGSFTNVQIGGVKPEVVLDACHVVVEHTEQGVVDLLRENYSENIDVRTRMCVQGARVCPPEPRTPTEPKTSDL